MANSDWIRIRGLRVDCVVGLYPEERDIAQPLELEVHLCLDVAEAAVREKLSLSFDYAALSDQLAFLLRGCRFRMLETAAHALCAYLLAPPSPAEKRAALTKARVILTKPTALGGRAIPSLEIEREAGFAVLGRETKPFGTVDVIFESRDAGIYRLNIAPGREIPLHQHRVMRESEMVLTRGLLCQGKPVAPGTVQQWPHGLPHSYRNPTRRYQSILCVDSPPFIEADEILVTHTAGSAS
jgi:FolB domain-containing protein